MVSLLDTDRNCDYCGPEVSYRLLLIVLSLFFEEAAALLLPRRKQHGHSDNFAYKLLLIELELQPLGSFSTSFCGRRFTLVYCTAGHLKSAIGATDLCITGAGALCW